MRLVESGLCRFHSQTHTRTYIHTHTHIQSGSMHPLTDPTPSHAQLLSAVPEMIGGSADLTPSNLTKVEANKVDFSQHTPLGRSVHLDHDRKWDGVAWTRAERQRRGRGGDGVGGGDGTGTGW